MEADNEMILQLPTKGKLGCLTGDEDALLDRFRDHVQKEMEINDPKFDDWYLLRFCRARKFKFDDVVLMFTNFINWRQENDVDNAISTDFTEIREFAKLNWEHGYYGVSRDGYPVYIERYEKTDIDKILKTYSEQQLTRYYVNSYELMLHCIWSEASRAAGRRIDAVVTILDLKNFGVMRMLKSDTRKFLSMATSVAQDYYPECQGKMFIINTGMTFSALWAVIKLMLDSKTRDKISVLGGKFMKEISKYVDPANLPKSLGGTCEKEIHEGGGPWKEYMAECTAKKNYFPDGVVQGDPWKEPARAALKNAVKPEE